MTHRPFSNLKFVLFCAVLSSISFSKASLAGDEGETSISKRVVRVGPAEKETQEKLEGFKKRFKSRAKKDLTTIKEDMMEELIRLRGIISPKEEKVQKKAWALGVINKLIATFGIRVSDEWSEDDYKDIAARLNTLFLSLAKEADAKQVL